jgi:hypothetical protein
MLMQLPPKHLVNLKGVQDGARRFAFILETSRPGSCPDAPLLAALLDLVDICSLSASVVFAAFASVGTSSAAT